MHARRAAALERGPDPLRAEHLRAPADAEAALAPDGRAGLRAPGLRRSRRSAAPAGRGRGRGATRCRVSTRLAAEQRLRRGGERDVGGGLRRRGARAARRLRGRASRAARRPTATKAGSEPGTGNEPHRCFLRCLRGELTGSRRESSATDAGCGRFAPVARRPHWVPRSPRWGRGDSARGNLARGGVSDARSLRLREAVDGALERLAAEREADLAPARRSPGPPWSRARRPSAASGPARGARLRRLLGGVERRRAGAHRARLAAPPSAARPGRPRRRAGFVGRAASASRRRRLRLRGARPLAPSRRPLRPRRAVGVAGSPSRRRAIRVRARAGQVAHHALGGLALVLVAHAASYSMHPGRVATNRSLTRRPVPLDSALRGVRSRTGHRCQ